MTVQQRFLTNRQEPTTGLLVLAWVVALLTSLYLLPWAVAYSRGKSNHDAIAVVNVLTGWTVIGWIVALVMACTAHQVVRVG